MDRADLSSCTLDGLARWPSFDRLQRRTGRIRPAFRGDKQSFIRSAAKPASASVGLRARGPRRSISPR